MSLSFGELKKVEGDVKLRGRGSGGIRKSASVAAIKKLCGGNSVVLKLVGDWDNRG